MNILNQYRYLKSECLPGHCIRENPCTWLTLMGTVARSSHFFSRAGILQPQKSPNLWRSSAIRLKWVVLLPVPAYCKTDGLAAHQLPAITKNNGYHIQTPSNKLGYYDLTVRYRYIYLLMCCIKWIESTTGIMSIVKIDKKIFPKTFNTYVYFCVAEWASHAVW